MLDNLKHGVIRPDLYESQLNPLYAALLAHYGAVADVCRVRSGSQGHGRERDPASSSRSRHRTSGSLGAALGRPRIHGRKKRQVLAMYEEERAHLRLLPIERFRWFRQETRTVDDAGCVQVNGSYYAASPAPLYSHATVRIYEHEIEILDDEGQILRRHENAARKGEYKLPEEDRIFNPSRETARLIGKVAKIGPHSAQLAREIFARLGRPGEKAIYGLANLPRRYKCADIEHAGEQVLRLSRPSYQALKRILERTGAAASTADASLQQAVRSTADDQSLNSWSYSLWGIADGTSPSDPCNLVARGQGVLALERNSSLKQSLKASTAAMGGRPCFLSRIAGALGVRCSRNR